MLDQTAAHHLSWVKGLHSASLHKEHVYEMNEDAWSMSGVLRRKDQPLVHNHEHEVAKQTQEEQQLWEKYQEQVVSLPKVPGSNGKQQADQTWTLKGISTFKNGYSHVVVSAENHAKAHVNDAHDH